MQFGAVALSSFAAYVFVRHKFPGREFLFMLIVALQIVPGVLTLTPTYLTVINLHLDNTWWALILPGIAGQQIGNIFIFRTFMANHPKEIYESAQLDGANEFVLYSRLCIPLSIPILTIQLIGIFASMYNDYMWPYLVIEPADADFEVARGEPGRPVRGTRRQLRRIFGSWYSVDIYDGFRTEIFYQRRFCRGGQVIIRREEIWLKEYFPTQFFFCLRSLC